MEIVKKLGYKVISLNDKGEPTKVWIGYLIEGDYGLFISIEKHWVNGVNSKGNPTQTNYAGRFFNFSADEEKALPMLEAITTLVKAGLKQAKALKSVQQVVEDDLVEELEVIEEDL